MALLVIRVRRSRGPAAGASAALGFSSSVYGPREFRAEGSERIETQARGWLACLENLVEISAGAAGRRERADSLLRLFVKGEYRLSTGCGGP